MTSSEGEPRPGLVLGAFALLSALIAIPLLSVDLPPLLDYPNHLARMHILSALGGASELAAYYRAAWAPIPDLALDAIVPMLAGLMPVEAAMKLFTIAMMIATAGGCLALHRVAFRRWSVWPLLAFLLLYNRIFLWGFLNYLAGLALLPWALAAWIALEKKPAALRIAIGTVAAGLLYFAHLAAFGCYAVALVLYEAGRPDGTLRMRESLGRTMPAAATLVLPALLFFVSPTAGASHGIVFGNPLRKLDLPVSIFDNYDRLFDGATFAVLTALLIFGLCRGKLRFHPRLRWSLVALLILYLAMPSQLLSASGIDHRLPIAIAILLMGSADWSGITREWRTRLALLLFALLTVRLAVIEHIWLRADATYASLVPALDLVPRGGALAVAAPPSAIQAGGTPLLHFPSLAARRHDAFVSTIFADPAQQPIVLTPLGTKMALQAGPPEQLWQRLATGTLPDLPGYDMLAIIDPPPDIDRVALPGPVLFRAPRLLLVSLPNPDRQRSQ